jgi:hypothetical protein
VATITRPNLAGREGFRLESRALERAFGAIRARRLAPRRPGAELPLWQQIVVLYTGLALVVGLVIALSFLVAWLATGSAY